MVCLIFVFPFFPTSHNERTQPFVISIFAFLVTTEFSLLGNWILGVNFVCTLDEYLAPRLLRKVPMKIRSETDKLYMG